MTRNNSTKNILLFFVLTTAFQYIEAKHTSRHSYRKPDFQPILCHNSFAFLAKDAFLPTVEDKVLPIVLVHGLTQNGAAMADTKALIQKLVPGVKIYTPDLPGQAFDNCAYQVQFLADYINTIPALKSGFNFVAHSMGGIIARGVIESGLLINPAYSLITLASPHRGVCGIPYALSEIERLTRKDMTIENPLYEIMYTEYMQNHSSIANIWNEPSQQEMYTKYNLYLPLENNEKDHPNNNQYKNRLASLLIFAALAAGKDTVLKPLESARGDYYDVTGSKIIPLEESPMYKNLGLDELTVKNKLKRFTVLDDDHSTIRTNESTLKNYVVPFLIHESQIRENTDSDPS